MSDVIDDGVNVQVRYRPSKDDVMEILARYPGKILLSAIQVADDEMVLRIGFPPIYTSPPLYTAPPLGPITWAPAPGVTGTVTPVTTTWAWPQNPHDVIGG